MRYRRLDENGDYSFGKGAQDFIFGADAVAQAIQTNLKLLQGEWWEDVTEGLQVFQNILGQTGSQEHLNAVDLIIRQRIQDTEGVSEVLSFTSTYSNRQYSVSCTVKTNEGKVVAIGEVNF